MGLKEQYKKETGNYAFDLQKRPTANYAQWLEQRLEAGQHETIVMCTCCPECGCEEYEHEDYLADGYRVCSDCGQEWYTDVNYTESKYT